MHISASEVIRLIARAIGANFKFFDPAYQYHVIQNPRILIINAIKIKNSIDLNVQRYTNNQNFFPEEKRSSQPDLYICRGKWADSIIPDFECEKSRLP